jgi:hypothetical protein
MDYRRKSAFLRSQICEISRLQVATVSDISTAEGRHITEKAFQASQNPQRRSIYKWIRQPDITDQQAKL